MLKKYINHRPGYKLVFRRFIRDKNGKRVYPKKAKCFAFWVPE